MSPKPWPHLKKIKKTKQNKTKIKTKNQFYVKPISHAIGHPSIHGKYTHPTASFGKSQISTITNIWIITNI